MHQTFQPMYQVLLIGGSTGTMLEALQVVGDAHDGHLGEVSSAKVNLWACLMHVQKFSVDGSWIGPLQLLSLWLVVL